MRKVITIILGTVLVFALVLTGLKSLFNSVFDDFKAEGWTRSWSAEQSRQRGILIAELIAEPSEPVAGDGIIRFTEVWLEEKSLSTHRFAWFPFEERTGEYLLYYSVEKYTGREPLLIYANDDNDSGSHVNYGGRVLTCLRLKSPDITNLRLSAASPTSDPRLKNIRFIPKP